MNRRTQTGAGLIESLVSLFVQRGHLSADLDGWTAVSLRGERVYADDEALREHLRERLRAPVRGVTVLEVDYVRDTMRLEVRLGAEEQPDGAVAVAGR